MHGLNMAGYNTVMAGEAHSSYGAIVFANCGEMVTRENRMSHGRHSAAITRRFLKRLGLPVDVVNEISYGIAIHWTVITEASAPQSCNRRLNTNQIRHPFPR